MKWSGPTAHAPAWSRPERDEAMTQSADPFPDLADLTAILAAILEGPGPARGSLTVMNRERSPDASTSPTEVVTCQKAGGGLVRLFCKYAAGRNHDAHGHRGGVAYEARVYVNILTPLRVTVPRFYGGHFGGPHG